MALAQAGADDIQLLPALWGAWAYWFVLGEHAVATSARRPRRADRARITPTCSSCACSPRRPAATTTSISASSTPAREQLTWGTRLRDVKPPEVFPHDPVVVAAATRAVTHWFLGQAELSRELAADAHDQLNALDASGRRTPLTLCFASCLLAWHAELDGDPAGAIALRRASDCRRLRARLPDVGGGGDDASQHRAVHPGQLRGGPPDAGGGAHRMADRGAGRRRPPASPGADDALLRRPSRPRPSSRRATLPAPPPSSTGSSATRRRTVSGSGTSSCCVCAPPPAARSAPTRTRSTATFSGRARWPDAQQATGLLARLVTDEGAIG